MAGVLSSACGLIYDFDATSTGSSSSGSTGGGAMSSGSGGRGPSATSSTGAGGCVDVGQPPVAAHAVDFAHLGKGNVPALSAFPGGSAYVYVGESIPNGPQDMKVRLYESSDVMQYHSLATTGWAVAATSATNLYVAGYASGNTLACAVGNPPAAGRPAHPPHGRLRLPRVGRCRAPTCVPIPSVSGLEIGAIENRIGVLAWHSHNTTWAPCPTVPGDALIVATFAADLSCLRDWVLPPPSIDLRLAQGIGVSGDGLIRVAGTFGSGTQTLFGKPLGASGPSDGFVARLDPHDTATSITQLRSARGMKANALVATQHGAIVVGAYEGTPEFDDACSLPEPSTGKTNALIFALSDDTDSPVVEWSRGFGNDDDVEATAVAIDDQENVLVLGTFQGKLNVDGRELDGAGAPAYFVLKLDSSGRAVWASAITSTEAFTLSAIGTRTTTDSVFIGGQADGLVKVDGTAVSSPAGLPRAVLFRLDP